jgi:low affinity Fe/Cu permease
MSEVLAHAATGVAAAGVIVVLAVIGIVYRFPAWWATTLYSVTASTTFVVVFVIQHTQARQTAATQRKLDELIRASTRADDGLIAIEEAPDAHLDGLTESIIAEREWP